MKLRILGSIALLAVSAGGQILSNSGQNPFQRYDREAGIGAYANRDGGTGANGFGLGGLNLRFPPAQLVKRSLMLRPAKPTLVLPSKKPGIKKRLSQLDRKRLAAVKAVREARSKRDFDGLRQGLKALEMLRQERLNYVRKVADRVAPEKPAAPDDGSGDEKNPTKPALPTPSLPPTGK